MTMGEDEGAMTDAADEEGPARESDSEMIVARGGGEASGNANVFEIAADETDLRRGDRDLGRALPEVARRRAAILGVAGCLKFRGRWPCCQHRWHTGAAGAL